MKAEPELIKPLADGFPELAVQARWAVKEEMAQSVSDVLLRRIPMALSGEVPASAVEKVASELAREYAWDAATKAKAIAEYDKDADVCRTPAGK
jgi:glycerol-3-phosphate dehydrogenase